VKLIVPTELGANESSPFTNLKENASLGMISLYLGPDSSRRCFIVCCNRAEER
jgi:hypothetical protein